MPTASSSALLGLQRGSTVANCFKFSFAGTSTIYYIVSSPREPRFVLVPIGFASEAWPRPGLAEPRSASLAGFGFFHQHIRKGKVVITKTSKEKRLLLGSFLAPETDMIFGDGVGGLPCDTKLSPLASTDLFPINWNPSRHCRVVVWLFVFCVGCFGCVFFCVVFAFGSLCFGFCFLLSGT